MTWDPDWGLSGRGVIVTLLHRIAPCLLERDQLPLEGATFVDLTDPAAAFLASVTVTEPQEVLTLLGKAPENTLEAFTLALKLGATGLETDVWLTADGVAVLDHDGKVKAGLRSRPIGSLDRRSLPAHVPTLEDLYAECGTGFELSLDIKDPAAATPVAALRAEIDPRPNPSCAPLARPRRAPAPVNPNRPCHRAIGKFGQGL